MEADISRIHFSGGVGITFSWEEAKWRDDIWAGLGPLRVHQSVGVGRDRSLKAKSPDQQQS